MVHILSHLAFQVVYGIRAAGSLCDSSSKLHSQAARSHGEAGKEQGRDAETEELIRRLLHPGCKLNAIGP